MSEELLPKPLTDLPLPEKEIPAKTGLAFQGVSLEGYGRKFPFPKFVFLGIGFVILLGVIGGAYFLGRNSILKELSPTAPAIPPKDPIIYEGTPTPDPTADWKTFESKYGYSFRYPSDLIASDKYSNTDVEEYFTQITNNIDESEKNNSNSMKSTSNFFNIFITNTDSKTDLQTLKNEYSTKYRKDYSIDDVIIGGEPGFKIKLGEYLYVTTVHNGKEYKIELTTTNSKLKSYYDQILSTFKFIN